jgi:hypothetical protein
MNQVLVEELKGFKRMKEKLLAKNGVLLSQRIRITEQIRLLQATSEVSDDGSRKFAPRGELWLPGIPFDP